MRFEHNGSWDGNEPESRQIAVVVNGAGQVHIDIGGMPVNVAGG
jgi:hypothetical protein